MKKMVIVLVILVSTIFLLAACGGGGGGDESQPPEVSTEKHNIKFLDATIEFTPATEGGEIIKLVQNSAPVSVPKSSITKVIWNYQCGWHTSGGTAIIVDFNQTGPTIIPQPTVGGTGLISLLDDQDNEYFINITEVDISGSTIPVTVDEANGLISYGELTPENLACP